MEPSQKRLLLWRAARFLLFGGPMIWVELGWVGLSLLEEGVVFVCVCDFFFLVIREMFYVQY